MTLPLLCPDNVEAGRVVSRYCLEARLFFAQSVTPSPSQFRLVTCQDNVEARLFVKIPSDSLDLELDLPGFKSSFLDFMNKNLKMMMMTLANYKTHPGVSVPRVSVSVSDVAMVLMMMMMMMMIPNHTQTASHHPGVPVSVSLQFDLVLIEAFCL